ncbi:hypothetical protein [Sulfuricurvum sp.]|uniref:hypothetical protein n=1 Tax=Sulfuricurvum sp. TaxID=2025608 RepID=UPI002617AFA3|nr:hypothetical protein [Sulfuricurvum sp.]MDD2780074.1 hypothetical protein [Sulfuricurvum sp.]
MIVLLGGCSVTSKVDLYKYKDVSTFNIVDEDKANYRVIRPTLHDDITLDMGKWHEYEGVLRDYFLVYNNAKEVFKVEQNGTYTLKLTLHNVSSSQQFSPSQYIERKRKIKTDKAIYIKDESYYTDPYWTYYVQTAIVAQLTTPQGEQKFFEAKDNLSYSVTGRYQSGINRSKYVESLQVSLAKLFKQIANSVAPEGLIVSKKVSIEDDEEFIFLINMGKDEGVYEGQKLLVYKEIVFKDEIEAKTITNKVRIGTATVSDQITAHYAWMFMDDEDHNSAIEVGDIIRPRY